MRDLTADLTRQVDEILGRHAAVGLAVGVVGPGGLEALETRGLADIASRMPVTADTVFRIASISKTFTAVAVMQLWEQGRVELDRPADDYLLSYRLVPRDPAWRPATLRHLLTHTSGVPKLARPLQAIASGWFGESVALDEPVPTLAAFYRGRLPVVVEPGTVSNYTDHGFATLGQIVEDVSGQSLADYLHDHVFAPLGMDDSDLLRSEHVRARLATGHQLRSSGPAPVVDRHWVTAAASSIYSTPRDMARYAAALLNGGEGEHGILLKPETVATMFAPHHRADPRLPGIGLGWPRLDLGGHPAVEHQGILPGFNAQLDLAPEDGVGVIAFTNGARNGVVWLTRETERLLEELLGVHDAGVRTDVPHHPEIWQELCGWYAPLAQRSDTQALAMLGAGVHVRARRGGLHVRALSPLPPLLRGFELHPDDPADPYAFRVDLSPQGLGTALVVFARDPGTGRMRLHVDAVQLSAERRS